MEKSLLFEDKSDLYAASRPLYPEALFQFIASLATNRNEAWDCATGNGQAAVGLANHFNHVEATDISIGQISNAFANEKINYSVQPAEQTTFEKGHFDLINVAEALHWFDLDRFWDEVKRVLKPDGAFVTYFYTWSNVNEEIDETVERYIGKVIEPYWAPNIKLCWDEYKTIKFPFDAIETPKFELINDWDFRQYFNYLHTLSATRRCMDARGQQFFEEAKKQVSQIWGSANKKKRIKTPLTVVAGYVQS